MKPFSRDDRDKLQALLTFQPSLVTPQARMAFLQEALANTTRRWDILRQVDVNGDPGVFAPRLIQRLEIFGNINDETHSLVPIIERLRMDVGPAEQMWLDGLLDKYEMRGAAASGGGGVLDDLTGGRWLGEDGATPSPDEFGKIKEKLIGDDTSVFHEIRVLELALTASRSVAYINQNGHGTGFLVAPNLMMTNNHVIKNTDEAQNAVFAFNHQTDVDNTLVPPHNTKAKPGGLFWTNADKNLDYTFVEIISAPFDAFPLKCNLRLDAAKKDCRIPIIQHPNGEMKQIVFQDNYIAFTNGHIVQYYTATKPGSSGSPCFNEAFEVIALHHAGGHILEPGTTRRYYRNEGICLSKIFADMRASADANAKAIHEYIYSKGQIITV